MNFVMTKSRKKHITKLICSFPLRLSVFIFHGVSVYTFHDIISLPAAELHNIRLRYIHGAHLRRKVMPELVEREVWYFQFCLRG